MAFHGVVPWQQAANQNNVFQHRTRVAMSDMNE